MWSLQIPQSKVIFVGDVIFAGSIGRTDLTGGDLDELLNSIRKTILSCPDETRLLPGHGPETSVGIERLNNPISDIKMGENFLAHLIITGNCRITWRTPPHAFRG